MTLSDKWGQGAVFAPLFSGPDSLKDGFFARLASDSFGFVFETKNRCTLCINADGIEDVTFSAVVANYISAQLKIGGESYEVKAIFDTPDTVLISSEYAIDIKVVFDKDISCKKTKKHISYTCDEEEFCLANKKANGRIVYAFTYGKDAPQIAEAALETSFDEKEALVLSFYESLPDPRFTDERINKLYYRCASVLLANICPPKGLIKSPYIAPSKSNMKSLYSFWSALSTIGLRHICPDIAKSTLESILSSQSGDGLIPSVVGENSKAQDINPPVLAWCLWELYLINNDDQMLKDAYAPLKKYLHHIIEGRDINNNHLFEWEPDDSQQRLTKESTMEASPRFEDSIVLDSVDLTAYVANEVRYMSLIADSIDKHGEALYWGVVFERIKASVNELLFDEDDKIYYDRAVVSNMLKKEKTYASFMPLFAGLCENRNAMALLKFLNTPDSFNAKNGVPSLSMDNKAFEYSLAKGSVHIHHNYFISIGLDRYDMHDKANELKAKSIAAVLSEYENNAVIYEYYSPDSKKDAKNLKKDGFSSSPFMFASKNTNIKDFVPTAAIVMDMLLSKSGKLPPVKKE